MKTIRLLVPIFVIIILSIGKLTAQVPVLDWADQFRTKNTGVIMDTMGGPSTSRGESSGISIALSSTNEVYTGGNFIDTVDFDPGPGVHNLIGTGSMFDQQYDAYISKLTTTGNFLWVKQIACHSGDPLEHITCDNDGNIYAIGNFYGKVDFNPSTAPADTFYLTGIGTTYSIASTFILKLDASGNFVWAKEITGYSSPHDNTSGYGIATDLAGNVYATGYFKGTVDFDPSASTYDLTAVVDSVNNSSDIYVLKLTAAGDFMWAKQFQSVDPLGFSWGAGIATDSLGNVYTTGHFVGTVDFNPNPAAADTAFLIYNSGRRGAIFVSKLTTNGDYVWAKSFGDPAYYCGGWATSITIGKLGDVYTTGAFLGTIDFNPGIAPADTFYLISNSAAYVSKLTNTGNFVWAKQFGYTSGGIGAGSAGGFSVTTDDSDNVYTTGSFDNTVDFNPDTDTTSAGIYNLTSTGNWKGTPLRDIFISKLTSSGNFAWAIAMGGFENDLGRGIVVDHSHSVYTTGQFSLFADFDPSDEVFDTLNTIYRDAFIQKLAQCTSSLGIVVITRHGDTLVASPAATYQWYRNDSLISGANTQSYSPTEAGNYTVCSTAHGETCTICSNPFSFTTGINEHSLTNTIAIYPNPNNGQFEIALQLNTQDNYTLELTNALGQVLYHEELKNFVGSYHKQLDETKYGAGVYLFRVKNSKEQSVKKVISW